MLDGFDHTPRLAAKRETDAPQERSSGIGTRRRFRSTTPGLVTRSTARPERVHLIDRIEGADESDPLTSPVQANVLQSLRRALAVAFVVSEQFADQTGLSGLLKDNLAGGLASAKKTEFGELLAASAAISLHVFANMAGTLVASSAAAEGESTVEIGEVEEILTDNPQLALHGALWELDQDLALYAKDEAGVVHVVQDLSDKLMEKVALRAGTLPRLGA